MNRKYVQKNYYKNPIGGPDGNWERTLLRHMADWLE